MALGSTQPLVKMSTSNIPGGKGGRRFGLTLPKFRSAVRHSETSTILTNINILFIYVFYLYENDGIPTCIAFTESPVKRPEDDLYIGRNM